LPGRKAQFKMASMRRVKEGNIHTAPDNARKGCVLLLLYPVNRKVYTVLIQRNEYDGVHSGQISLPGGEMESRDQTHMDAALREAYEETGIIPEKVNIIGSLTDLYIPPSNFLVTPIVGYSLEKPDFRADPAEVKRIIEVDLEVLSRPDSITKKRILIRYGYAVTAPCYYVEGNIIWGATAMILSEFLDMLH
jgi:8-oxo-dGTP pyrophosphatase MutT (NUDIX family)